MRVAEALKLGEARYADAVAELSQLGPAEFTQTGGMCAALQVTLERGYLLVTDAEDSLPWDRGDLRGWGVGFYWSDDVSEGPEVFVSGEDTAVEALGVLARGCLSEVAATREPGAGEPR